jgi:ABC-type uncharacterized transport system substrate-binding protein
MQVVRFYGHSYSITDTLVKDCNSKCVLSYSLSVSTHPHVFIFYAVAIKVELSLKEISARLFFQ